MIPECILTLSYNHCNLQLNNDDEWCCAIQILQYFLKHKYSDQFGIEFLPAKILNSLHDQVMKYSPNDTLPETNKSQTESGWLEYDRFLLGPGPLSGAFAVSFREGNPAKKNVSRNFTALRILTPQNWLFWGPQKHPCVIQVPSTPPLEGPWGFLGKLVLFAPPESWKASQCNPRGVTSVTQPTGSDVLNPESR